MKKTVITGSHRKNGNPYPTGNLQIDNEKRKINISAHPFFNFDTYYKIYSLCRGL